MKHLGAILCALILIAFAAYLLVSTKACGLTTMDKWQILGLLLFALALAIPAQFKVAAGTVRDFLPIKAAKPDAP